MICDMDCINKIEYDLFDINRQQNTVLCVVDFVSHDVLFLTVPFMTEENLCSSIPLPYSVITALRVEGVCCRVE